MALNILGADLRPKGRAVSTHSFPSHCMPSSRRSVGCTGTIRYALYMSNFASWVLDPIHKMVCIALSTDAYLREHRLALILSLTLLCFGWDRLTIIRHLPG